MVLWLGSVLGYIILPQFTPLCNHFLLMDFLHVSSDCSQPFTIIIEQNVFYLRIVSTDASPETSFHILSFCKYSILTILYSLRLSPVEVPCHAFRSRVKSKRLQLLQENLFPKQNSREGKPAKKFHSCSLSQLLQQSTLIVFKSFSSRVHRMQKIAIHTFQLKRLCRKSFFGQLLLLLIASRDSVNGLNGPLTKETNMYKTAQVFICTCVYGDLLGSFLCNYLYYWQSLFGQALLILVLPPKNGQSFIL